MQTVRSTAPRVRQAPQTVVRRSSGAGYRQASPGPQGTGYKPPLHGSNPHGQGTVAVLDLSPSGTRPLGGNPSGSQPQPQDNEDLVVGRSRGEQMADGSYRGHITIAALLGNEIIGVDAGPGQTTTGPLETINQQILGSLCNNTSQGICLRVLDARSSATGSGSQNHFAAADARLGGPGGLGATAAESNGNISQDGSCQNAHGDTQAANVTSGTNVVATLTKSSTDSRACSDGTRTQSNRSQVLNLGGSGVGIPAAGCSTGGPDGTGTPNTSTGISVLLPIICNADDSNTTQAAVPYGVREALSIFLLDRVLKTTAAASESHAVAPAGGPGGPGPGGRPGGEDEEGGPGGERGERAGAGAGAGARRVGLGAGAGARGAAAQCADGVDNDGDGKIDFGSDPQCVSRQDDSEADGAGLPVTGTELVLMLMLGGFTLASGLTLYKVVGRRATA